MGKIKISEEERKRRSENMRRLHAEGRAGPQFGKLGGRPRTPRATEIAAEKIAEDADYLYEKLREKIDSETEKVSLDAIKYAYELEERHRKMEVDEEVRYEQLRRAELEELVIANLAELVGSGQLELGELVIDGEAHEVRPAIESGENNGRAQEANVV